MGNGGGWEGREVKGNELGVFFGRECENERVKGKGMVGERRG